MMGINGYVTYLVNLYHARKYKGKYKKRLKYRKYLKVLCRYVDAIQSLENHEQAAIINYRK